MVMKRRSVSFSYLIARSFKRHSLVFYIRYNYIMPSAYTCSTIIKHLLVYKKCSHVKVILSLNLQHVVYVVNLQF